MRTITLIVAINLADEGNMDAPHIASSVDHAIGRAIAEGVLTPDDDTHAMVVSHTVEEVA
jgi:hypothetical protein